MPIHSYLFASPAFAEKNPDAVAKFVAVYLRAVAWERANPKETENYLKAWFNSVGVKFPDKYLAQELRDRPAYTLSEQLKIFAGAPAATSEIVKWWNEVGKFMVSVGVIGKIPEPSTTVSAKFLKMVDSDAKLKSFATEFAK